MERHYLMYRPAMNLWWAGTAPEWMQEFADPPVRGGWEMWAAGTAEEVAQRRAQIDEEMCAGLDHCGLSLSR